MFISGWTLCGRGVPLKSHSAERRPGSHCPGRMPLGFEHFREINILIHGHKIKFMFLKHNTIFFTRWYVEMFRFLFKLIWWEVKTTWGQFEITPNANTRQLERLKRDVWMLVVLRAASQCHTSCKPVTARCSRVLCWSWACFLWLTLRVQ